MKTQLPYSLILFLLCLSCTNERIDSDSDYLPTPSPLQIPQVFKDNILAPIIPQDNAQTIEGIALGKKLFFDPILSANNTLACVTCHSQQHAFTNPDRFSAGINGTLGNRNAMPLFNLAWNYDEKFFWDGSVFSLEQQAFLPITNPIEMNTTWADVEKKLQQHLEYPDLFKKAFGTSVIDSIQVTKAIAQFERTLISANSKFDRHLLGIENLTPQEINGFNIFMDEAKGDCFHCHGNANNPLWTDNLFHNNGLDTMITDLGLGAITGDPADNGKFKSPSLRNLAYTAPYMHDGRFTTLEAVINHYSDGLKPSTTIDPLMKKVNQGGVKLSTQDKLDLKLFLLTLSDETLIHSMSLKND